MLIAIAQVRAISEENGLRRIAIVKLSAPSGKIASGERNKNTRRLRILPVKYARACFKYASAGVYYKQDPEGGMNNGMQI